MSLADVTYSADRSHARSMVISRRGIVATSQTLASQAGAQILARGGNAVDAAIAANAVLGVVEPLMDGIGGDLFAIHRDGKTGKLAGINASGWTPKALTPELLRQKGHSSMPQQGILSATVPGCVDGWEKLHRKLGRLPWKELFRPAIYYAREGFPVTELIQSDWEGQRGKLAADENARRLFLPNGEAPKVGEVLRNPPLARALELIAQDGAAAFYRGPIAQSILKTSRRLGGVFTAEDLSEFQSDWAAPISIEYRGWRVYEMPPNGQGMAALIMLNIMERFPLPKLAPLGPDAFHVKIEAQKLAFADLQRYLADPRLARVPVAGLLAKSYAAPRAALIKSDSATCAQPPGKPPLPPGGDTTYLAVVDEEGSIVSLIQSVSSLFGSGVVTDDFGFHLHDRDARFVLEADHPNVLAGRKRPFHTIIPGYMEKGELHVGFGIMGGLNQPQAHAQFVSNLVDHGMNLQAALEAPRFTKRNFGGCDVVVEGRVPEATQAALRRRGHQLEVVGDYAWGAMGGGQAVMHDSRARVNYGASSPRKDGAAIPQPDPYF